MKSTRVLVMFAYALGVISVLTVGAAFTTPWPNGLVLAIGGAYIAGGVVLYMGLPQEKLIDRDTKITLWAIFVTNSVAAGYWTYQLLQAKSLDDQFLKELSVLGSIAFWVVASILFVYRRQIMSWRRR